LMMLSGRMFLRRRTASVSLPSCPVTRSNQVICFDYICLLVVSCTAFCYKLAATLLQYLVICQLCQPPAVQLDAHLCIQTCLGRVVSIRSSDRCLEHRALVFLPSPA
jgi:hypothetical protein